MVKIKIFIFMQSDFIHFFRFFNLNNLNLLPSVWRCVRKIVIVRPSIG